MVKATISTTVDYEIAEKIENEAIKKNITVSQLLRDIITEKFKSDIP